uniref:Uncharacterized protein n=1 Tax=Astyanax mexicanus TaxID=7994 RepID=A0A8B9K479_ASTMX
MAASLVRCLRGLYVLFLICLLFASAFLNLEELNEMKYGIQILPDPVIMGQVSLQAEEVMLLTRHVLAYTSFLLVVWHKREIASPSYVA